MWSSSDNEFQAPCGLRLFLPHKLINSSIEIASALHSIWYLSCKHLFILVLTVISEMTSVVPCSTSVKKDALQYVPLKANNLKVCTSQPFKT